MKGGESSPEKKVPPPGQCSVRKKQNLLRSCIFVVVVGSLRLCSADFATPTPLFSPSDRHSRLSSLLLITLPSLLQTRAARPGMPTGSDRQYRTVQTDTCTPLPPSPHTRTHHRPLLPSLHCPPLSQPLPAHPLPVLCLSLLPPPRPLPPHHRCTPLLPPVPLILVAPLTAHHSKLLLLLHLTPP